MLFLIHENEGRNDSDKLDEENCAKIDNLSEYKSIAAIHHLRTFRNFPSDK